MDNDDVACTVKNTATLTGALFTLHACQVRIEMPTLSDKDKEVSTLSTVYKQYRECIWLQDAFPCFFFV